MYDNIIYTKNGEAYYIKRTIPEQQLRDPNMEILKKWFHCDTVLRNDGILYFCDHIKTIDYEEIQSGSKG